jgi:type I restriction enzyme M protein
MYENAFNSIERTLRSEEGIANELDYVEQISGVLLVLSCVDGSVYARVDLS